MASGIVESSPSPQEQQPQKQQQVARQMLVQRLEAASASMPNFMQELIRQQARVVAGTEAAAFMIERTSAEAFSLQPIAHVRDDGSDEETRVAAINAFKDIVATCVEKNKEGAILIDGSNDGSESQYCLVSLLRSDGGAVAATAVITRARDQNRAVRLLELIGIVGGYFELFTLRRKDEQSRAVAQSHQHVLQLATAVGTGDGFDASAMNLCNELASRSGAARVSLGWVRNEHIKLRALSHTEEFDKKQELSVVLVKVMEECLDNDEIVQYEPGGATTNTVTREAQGLSRLQGGETILSLPLRRNGEIVGVLTLEFAPNSKIGTQAATGLAVAVDLLAPQLYDRFQNDRYITTKMGLSVVQLGERTLSKKYWLAKSIAVLVAAVLVFITLYKPMYHVKATFSFTPIEKRTYGSPFEGAMLKEVLAKPGQLVHAGDPLLEFDSTDWKLKKVQASSDANKAGQQVLMYRADPTKTADMMAAQFEQQSAQAQVEYCEEQIKKCTIRAPFECEVLTGDLDDKRGAIFKQGEQLMEVAQRESLRAEIAVNERDIQDVHLGARGALATTAEPGDQKPITIERIVPAGMPKEQANVFTVYATLDESSGEWRPGMQGEARIDVGNRRLIWIWTHRFTEFVRLKLWI